MFVLEYILVFQSYFNRIVFSMKNIVSLLTIQFQRIKVQGKECNDFSFAFYFERLAKMSLNTLLKPVSDIFIHAFFPARKRKHPGYVL